MCDSKTCRDCGETKPVSDFYFTRKRGVSYPSSYCKTCSNARNKAWRTTNPERDLERMAKWRAANPDYQRKWAEKNPRKREKNNFRARAAKYQMTEAELASLLASRGGRCWICGAECREGRCGFHVDHCHETGRVRGVLCHHCNIGLGHFRDNIELLEKAVLYLKDFEAIASKVDSEASASCVVA
jgi:hypothetical protein